ncbi:MBL fold metallo-hydrolase [Mycobacterium sp. djl-10]|nr:MBL fold metallo-hydrolase [Mycobacterium sp. djl-10]
MNQIQLGDVTVTRVMEFFGSVELAPEVFFPDSRPQDWVDHQQWLAPDFHDPASNTCISALQTWVLRSEGRTILIDTGAGNHKERPGSVWHHRRTAYLDNLAQSGVRPEDVDLVVNTHLHDDHVGWNTMLVDGEWVPTFPNATYLMSRADFEFWDPANANPSRVGHIGPLVFEDSVAPVHRAGLVQLWDDHHDIDSHLRLDLAPGHTPGSSILTLRSGSDRAVFVGDMLHTPLQMLTPEVNSCYCEDQAQARATRRRVLGQAADTRTLVFPAHLGGHGAAEIRHRGAGFEIAEWAAFPRVTHA